MILLPEVQHITGFIVKASLLQKLLGGYWRKKEDVPP